MVIDSFLLPTKELKNFIEFKYPHHRRNQLPGDHIPGDHI